MDERRVRAAVATAARIMVTARLAEAFGHVSARFGEGFAITSTRPFITSGPDDVIMIRDLVAVPPASDGIPLESHLHAAVYRSRTDVAAVCRGHPPAAVIWGASRRDLPLRHGLGALAGRTVLVHDDVNLVTTAGQADAVAGTLGSAWSVLLRGNGALAVGRSLEEAFTRLYFLEERAAVALRAGPDEDDVDWDTRLGHTEAELVRAMDWLQATFGELGTSERRSAYRPPG